MAHRWQTVTARDVITAPQLYSSSPARDVIFLNVCQLYRQKRLGIICLLLLYILARIKGHIYQEGHRIVTVPTLGDFLGAVPLGIQAVST